MKKCKTYYLPIFGLLKVSFFLTPWECQKLIFQETDNCTEFYMLHPIEIDKHVPDFDINACLFAKLIKI